MSKDQRPKDREELLQRLMYYFQPDVLAVFHSRPDKYRLETDDFSGHVEISNTFQDPLNGTKDASRLSVDFGFRACKAGQWAIAAYGPDLDKASANDKRLWTGRLAETDLSDAPDSRFSKWVERYIDGSWEVEDGPIGRLDHVVQQINSVTQCVVNSPLFTAPNIRSLCFPAAENNHRYHDAHSEAYKYLQDALSRKTIDQLAVKFGVVVKSGGKWTVTALKQLLPENLHAEVTGPLEVVSANRNLGDHKRPPAASFPAFETFSRDIEAVVRGMEVLRDWLTERLNLDLDSCEKRSELIRHLPTLDDTRPAQPHYGIFNAFQSVGKQIVRVQAGYCSSKTGRPDSEALILEFSDGSLLGIDAITNITQLIHDADPITPEALHVAFDVTYVPPLQPHRRQTEAE